MGGHIQQAVEGLAAETHCHTIGCSHAYSTITENAAEAARQGLGWLAITEHGPAMLDGPHPWFFGNMAKTLPRELYGVKLLYGAELNILDFAGTLDLEEIFLSRLEWVIASYHTVCRWPGSRAENTEGWLSVAKNPKVTVIGHCGDGRYDFHHEEAIKAFRDNGKIVEINSHSFDTRPGSKENCADIARWCKRLDVPVVVSSDAHFFTQIGRVGKSLEMLEEVEYPRERILNLDAGRFAQALRERGINTEI